jgi:hypothetical protein
MARTLAIEQARTRENTKIPDDLSIPTASKTHKAPLSVLDSGALFFHGMVLRNIQPYG